MISVGIDVSKDKHDCFIVSSEGEVLADVFTIPNNMDGFHCLLQKIQNCTNTQTISDLLKMDLSIYAIKVGRTSLENLNVNKELGMKVSILPKDNPSYEPSEETDNAVSNSPVLDVFDVLLAGVEADD
ncbi:MAG: DUF6414 family protein [Eubacterium ramulus]|uniref:IS110 family transposase n=1 Tax=Eubacterium ramulus TaxID=39490 RepID=UPI00399F65FE